LLRYFPQPHTHNNYPFEPPIFTTFFLDPCQVDHDENF
jgi:hypothetical protein